MSPKNISETTYVSATFTWTYGGRDALVTGSFNEWEIKVPLQHTGNGFYTDIPLKPGVYQYKYIVDGTWKFDPNRPITKDPHGNINNILQVDVIVNENESDEEEKPPNVVDHIPQQKAEQNAEQPGVDTDHEEEIMQENMKPKTRRKKRSFKIGVAIFMKSKNVHVSQDVLERCNKMHRKIPISPFDVVVKNSPCATLPSSEEVPSGPVSPRSCSSSPTSQRRFLRYDPQELPYLVRTRLAFQECSCTFNPKDRHEQIQLTHANHVAVKAASSLYRSVRSSVVIPESKSVYFEMFFLDQKEPGGICIGLSNENFPLNSLLGTKSNSVGYYSSGNIIYRAKWEKYGRGYSVGDTIGCLIRMDPENECFIRVHLTFFVNGLSLGTPGPTVVLRRSNIFPTISMFSVGTKVECRFLPFDLQYASSLPDGVYTLDGAPVRCGPALTYEHRIDRELPRFKFSDNHPQTPQSLVS